MSALPDAQSIVRDARLPPSSHLSKVLHAELHRLERMALTPHPPHRHAAGTFEHALRQARAHRGGAIIAEYKQGSPSLGPFALGTALDSQIAAYKEGGAACVSILAEPAFFLGSTEDVEAAGVFGLPRLYKGFVISAAHLDEAASCGAEAVLLIARVLRGHTAAFADAARVRGLEPLVELHDLTEVPFAQGSSAAIVGINARDLATFTLGAPDAGPLRAAFPDAVLVRESGLATPEDAVAAFRAGFDAALIGEALMRSVDPAAFLRRIFAALHQQEAS
ncbi:MAG TPA: indole-3-glycerol-phosphate synthase [Holophagaceae bacterium]|jgi:indole-3-glycerol phosphate synthase|nr:indole-3-glycerol-phosphate synthase [Holophagaceae bacterium]